MIISDFQYEKKDPQNQFIYASVIVTTGRWWWKKKERQWVYRRCAHDNVVTFWYFFSGENNGDRCPYKVDELEQQLIAKEIRFKDHEEAMRVLTEIMSQRR